MDILGAFQFEGAFFDVGKDIDEGVADLFGALFGNDLRFSQHFDVRDACQNVVPVQFVVEAERLIKVIRAFGAGLRKAAFP